MSKDKLNWQFIHKRNEAIRKERKEEQRQRQEDQQPLQDGFVPDRR